MSIRAVDVGVWDWVQFPTARAREWTRHLTTDPNVKAVIAIGSAARRLARDVSDLDLIVVCKNTSTKTKAPPEIDARWIAENDLDAAAAKGDDVVAWGVAFGVALHDPTLVWKRLVDSWRDRVPLPSRDVCAQRASRARRYAEELVESGDTEAAAEQALTMLTHVARFVLSGNGMLPASRPELVDQLMRVGALELASLLKNALAGTLDPCIALESSATKITPP